MFNRRRTIGELADLAEIRAQIDTLWNWVNYQSRNTSNIHRVSCDFCGGNHRSIDCQIGNNFATPYENTNYCVSNYGRNPNHFNMTNPYSNTYNPEWQNYPNLQWGGHNQPALWAPPVDSPYAPLKDMMRQLNQRIQTMESNLVQTIEKDLKQTITQTIQETMDEDTTSTNEWLHQDAVNRDIERQIEQITQQTTTRPYGSSPCDTEKKPRDHMNAIILRDDNELKTPVVEEKEEDPVPNPYTPPIPYPERLVPRKMLEVESKKEQFSSSQAAMEEPVPNPYTPPVPYPERLIKKKKQIVERPYSSLPMENTNAIRLQSGKELKGIEDKEEEKIEEEEAQLTKAQPSYSQAEKELSPNSHTSLIPYPE